MCEELTQYDDFPKCEVGDSDSIYCYCCLWHTCQTHFFQHSYVKSVTGAIVGKVYSSEFKLEKNEAHNLQELTMNRIIKSLLDEGCEWKKSEKRNKIYNGLKFDSLSNYELYSIKSGYITEKKLKYILVKKLGLPNPLIKIWKFKTYFMKFLCSGCDKIIKTNIVFDSEPEIVNGRPGFGVFCPVPFSDHLCEDCFHFGDRIQFQTIMDKIYGVDIEIDCIPYGKHVRCTDRAYSDCIELF